jgi:pimeloyl-ACP methyl ester carboxylesterase
MTDELPIVLLHGSATGSYSWAAVRTGLEAHGAMVVVPDMLGYGRSPTPSEAWQPASAGTCDSTRPPSWRRRPPPRSEDEGARRVAD